MPAVPTWGPLLLSFLNGLDKLITSHMKKTHRILILLLSCAVTIQAAAADKDSTAVIKKGWTFGALPSIGYNSDLGFQYGALAEVYNYGDGSIFPQYKHLMYVEVNYTTKRSGLFRFFYDSKYLIPGVRVTLDLSYVPEAMADFLGFNGYRSVYNDKPLMTEGNTAGNIVYKQ